MVHSLEVQNLGSIGCASTFLCTKLATLARRLRVVSFFVLLCEKCCDGVCMYAGCSDSSTSLNVVDKGWRMFVMPCYDGCFCR